MTPEQIEKAAKEWFNQEMKTRGFSCNPEDYLTHMAYIAGASLVMERCKRLEELVKLGLDCMENRYDEEREVERRAERFLIAYAALEGKEFQGMKIDVDPTMGPNEWRLKK